jgi:hypothetical protein
MTLGIDKMTLGIDKKTLRINKNIYFHVKGVSLFLKQRNPYDVLKKIFEKLPPNVKTEKVVDINNIISSFKYTAPELYSIGWYRFMICLISITDITEEDRKNKLLFKDQWIKDVWSIYTTREF